MKEERADKLSLEGCSTGETNRSPPSPRQLWDPGRGIPPPPLRRDWRWVISPPRHSAAKRQLSSPSYIRSEGSPRSVWRRFPAARSDFSLAWKRPCSRLPWSFSNSRRRYPLLMAWKLSLLSSNSDAMIPLPAVCRRPSESYRSRRTPAAGCPGFGPRTHSALVLLLLTGPTAS